MIFNVNTSFMYFWGCKNKCFSCGFTVLTVSFWLWNQKTDCYWSLICARLEWLHYLLFINILQNNIAKQTKQQKIKKIVLRFCVNQFIKQNNIPFPKLLDSNLRRNSQWLDFFHQIRPIPRTMISWLAYRHPRLPNNCAVLDCTSCNPVHLLSWIESGLRSDGPIPFRNAVPHCRIYFFCTEAVRLQRQFFRPEKIRQPSP